MPTKQVTIIIHINPNGVDWTSDLISFKSYMGDQISTPEELKFNNIGNDYSIIFSEKDFKRIDSVKMISEVISNSKNFNPDKMIKIILQYNFKLNDGRVKLDKNVIFNVMKAHSFLLTLKDQIVYEPRLNELYKVHGVLRDYFGNHDVYFNYMPENRPVQESYQNMDNIKNIMRNNKTNHQFFEDIYPDNYFDDYDEYDYDYDYEDDDDDDDDYESESSYVWENLDNRKKIIKRHGILIGSRKDIERDSEIISDFIDKFIPDDSKFAEKFKEELLERFIGVYVITKKRLKKKEKEFRNKRRRPRKKNNKSSNKNMTISSWYDITR